jgi:hypothetical protein
MESTVLRRWTPIIIFLAASVGFSSCGPAIPNPFDFSGGDVPQIDLSSPRSDWVWNDPHAIKVDSLYVMYASGVHIDRAAGKWEYPERLYRFTSTDGASWKLDPPDPILVPSDSGWDSGGVETPAVLFFNGAYHLFYTGYPYDPDTARAAGYGIDVNTTHVGHAVSADGIHFSRDALPLVSASGVKPGDHAFSADSWYCFATGEPGPVAFDGKIYLYFTALGFNASVIGSLRSIGLVSSPDGANWGDPELALKPDQGLYPRFKDLFRTQGWEGYSTPNAIALKDGIHLFFDVAYASSTGSWTQLRLHHAQSSDGRTGWVQDRTALSKNTDFNWTEREIRSPSALLDGDILRLFFSGDDMSSASFNWGIGMMECVLSSR